MYINVKFKMGGWLTRFRHFVLPTPARLEAPNAITLDHSRRRARGRERPVQESQKERQHQEHIRPIEAVRAGVCRMLGTVNGRKEFTSFAGLRWADGALQYQGTVKADSPD